MAQKAKNKKVIKIITVAALTALVAIVFAVVFVIIQNVQLQRRRDALVEQIAYYSSLQDDKEDEAERRKIIEDLEQQARELGIINEDETLLKAE